MHIFKSFTHPLCKLNDFLLIALPLLNGIIQSLVVPRHHYDSHAKELLDYVISLYDESFTRVIRLSDLVQYISLSFQII